METDDESMTRETIADADMHAIHHAMNVNEHDDLWRECEALQKQIDELYKIVIDRLCER